MKKKIMLVFVTLFLSLQANPVLAANIYSCESSMKGALIDEKIPNVVSTVITVIKIAVPVLIVIFGMLDLMKGITAQKEDEMKKGQQLFIKRLISGALVFFVVTIVQLLISFVGDDKDKANMMTCAKCFINGDCTYRPENSTSSNPVGTCPDGTKFNEDSTYCVKE